MSDFQCGTELYFLDRIDTTTEKSLDVLQEILELERAARDRTAALEEESKKRGHQEAEMELTRLFSEVCSLARRPDIIGDFVARLKEDSLAQLARATTVIQDVLHETAMRKLKEQAEAQGAVTSETLEGVTAPFVAIVPK